MGVRDTDKRLLRQGFNGVWLTASEKRCYELLQRWRRRMFTLQLLNLRPIFWPSLLNRLNWSVSAPHKLLQSLVVLLFWPLMLLWGLCFYLARVVLFPFRFLGTFITPRGLTAPGEKSIKGMHHAFAGLMDLPAQYQMQCVDQWVAVLFGEKVALQQNLSINVDIVQAKPSLRDSAVKLPLKRAITLALEALSQDLGHYLVEAK